MIRLSREIRFAIPPVGAINSRSESNSWAGWPATGLVVPHLVLRCVVMGEPDPVTGYLVNIKVVDQMLQKIAIEKIIEDHNRSPQSLSAEFLTREIFQVTTERWPTIDGTRGEIELIELSLSPYLKFSVDRKSHPMVQLTQQFEFSAAHRLNCPEMNEQENEKYFGKCNNPNGHGHNYFVDVTVEGGEGTLDLFRLEKTVKQTVIDRLDHKHLNEDVDYFRTINPSVENIAQGIFSWLKDELKPMKLKRIRVYETPKTWAECEAE